MAAITVETSTGEFIMTQVWAINECKHNKTVEVECLDCHWNAAIEEAAKMAEYHMDKTVPDQIRRLKK